MPELLLEVGTEELPASFVRKAYEDLRASIQSLLAAEGLEGSAEALGTPRRLIVSVTGLPDRQPDSQKESRGPALKSAFDADGNPTPALLGFCRGQGVDVATVRRDEQYVWVTKHIEGRLTRDVLAELLPKAIRGLSFEKSMRWGAYRQRFARPIRWLLAAFDGEAVPFAIEGVTSGLESRGHRFYAPESFGARTFAELVAGLRERKVEPDPEIRSAAIVNQARAVAGGTPDLPESLVDENTFLTEWPTAIVGTFPEALLALPEPVLVTAMAKHEKMFPVRGDDGALLNRFVFTRNNGEDETVRKGCEWVLNARFNDARFFFEEDKKSSLDDFLAKTEGIVFQAELGTVRDRADRLAELTAQLAAALGEDPELGRQAGLYAKADLSTGLVSELSSLQGVIGGVYAHRAGLPEAVAVAIRDQYDASAAGETALGAALSAADALDKLAGYLGIGLAPTGSSDPYGLRRAATTLIELAWARSEFADWGPWFALALTQYSGVTVDKARATELLAELFESRYGALLGMVRYDLLAGAVSVPLAPRGVLFRTRALEKAAGDTTLVQTATRPINLVSSAEKKGIAVGDPEAHPLREVLAGAAVQADQAVRAEDPAALVAVLKGTVDPINAYLDATMIMVDDEAVRAARLGLLNEARALFLRAGDFTKIVG